MHFRQILDYYSREDVQQRMMEAAKSREVAGVFRSGAFGQRPASLQYPADITSMAENGAMEFHCSIERWSQPMAVKADNYGQLRAGWDFVADIDCEDFRHGRAGALVLCKALEKHGIRNYSVKFTGGTGFHVGVPWESMPKKIDYKPALSLFPGLPRAICLYLKEYCRDELEKALLKLDSEEKLAEQAKIKLGELQTKEGINPFKLVDIDAVLISPRHLFRMPYSLNIKSMLASLPVKPSDVASFERRDAEPSKLKAVLGFLNSGAEEEAGTLVAEAMDWQLKNKKSIGQAAQRAEIKFSRAVEPEHFPPCIKLIMQGLQDGRKRSTFILANFLSSAGWKWDAIERALFEWNSKNTPPLAENLIRATIRSNRGRIESQGRGLLPPACKNEGWYESIGVCFPDSICGAGKSVKNPANYPVRKLGMLKREKPARGSGRTRTSRLRFPRNRDAPSSARTRLRIRGQAARAPKHKMLAPKK